MVRLISSPPEPGQYAVVNQVSGLHKVKYLAESVAKAGKKFDLDIKIQRIENPRVEAEEHPLEVVSTNLPNDFGFTPTTNPEKEIESMLELLVKPEIKNRIEEKKHAIMPKTWWNGEKKDSGVLEVYEPGTKETSGYEGKLDT
jgi:UDP-sulfoquinovose synthase